MIIKGYSKVFSTKKDIQYNEIGDFWDYMSNLFGIDNLRGLGFNWGFDTIEYLISNKDGLMFPYDIEYPGAIYKETDIPDSGWITYNGYTNKLAELYKSIYKDGTLDFEIEEFSNDGTCKISVHRNR